MAVALYEQLFHDEGEVEVDPGRSPGQPEINSEFPVIFCVEDVFFQARGGTIYRKNRGATSIASPMWEYSDMGGAPCMVRQP